WWSTVLVGGYLDGLLAKPWRLGTKQMILIDPQQPTLILVLVSLISRCHIHTPLSTEACSCSDGRLLVGCIIHGVELFRMQPC
ncbi:unnamed protein product, partial [Urochloa humidicola]